eukprot:m.433032 g.433032  ORF g.433032 m.433032 type:complete len:82 (-) comp21416_c1_seq15:199-444(-)
MAMKQKQKNGLINRKSEVQAARGCAWSTVPSHSEALLSAGKETFCLQSHLGTAVKDGLHRNHRQGQDPFHLNPFTYYLIGE